VTPERFNDLLDRATLVAPPPPPAGAEVVQGRRMLRRRRAAALVGTLCAASVGLGMAAWAASDSSDPVVAVDGVHGTENLVAACLKGRAYTATGEPTDAGRLFGGPETEVRNALDAGQQAVAAIDSGDWRYWAECVVHHDADERATMVVFDGRDRAPAPAFAVGPDCPPAAAADGCPSWHVYAAFRLPDDVGWVRIRLADGGVVDVPTRDGFFVLNRVGPVPGGLDFEQWAADEGFAPVVEATYYGPGGHKIAAGAGPGLTQPVDGLPPLSTYPVQGTPQEVLP